MSQNYRSESDPNDTIEIEPSALKHVRSLNDLTGVDTAELIDEAVRLLKEQMLPSTKKPSEARKAGRKPKSAGQS